MTGWNLPPGCEVSHIPGNRPEDEREEWLWLHGPEYAEAYSDATFAASMYDGPNRGHGTARSVLGWMDGCEEWLAAEAMEEYYREYERTMKKCWEGKHDWSKPSPIDPNDPSVRAVYCKICGDERITNK